MFGNNWCFFVQVFHKYFPQNVASYIETNYLIYTVKQMTGFYLKYDTAEMDNLFMKTPNGFFKVFFVKKREFIYDQQNVANTLQTRNVSKEPRLACIDEKRKLFVEKCTAGSHKTANTQNNFELKIENY